MCDQFDAEDKATPSEHQSHLEDADNRQISPLSEEELIHRKSAAKQSVQSGVFAFFEE